MNYIQPAIPEILLSLPIAGIFAIVRGMICSFRCQRAKNKMFLFLSLLCILLITLILAAAVVVLFAYGVAHTGKDEASDLIVLASTVIPTYGVAIGIWLSFRAMEKRLNPVGV